MSFLMQRVAAMLLLALSRGSCAPSTADVSNGAGDPLADMSMPRDPHQAPADMQWADKANQTLHTQEAYDAVQAVNVSEQEAENNELMAVAGKNGSGPTTEKKNSTNVDISNVANEQAPGTEDSSLTIANSTASSAATTSDDSLHENHWADFAYQGLRTQEAYDAVTAVDVSEREAKYHELMAAAGKNGTELAAKFNEALTGSSNSRPKPEKGNSTNAVPPNVANEQAPGTADSSAATRELTWADRAFREVRTQEAYDAVTAVDVSEQEAKYKEVVAASIADGSYPDLWPDRVFKELHSQQAYDSVHELTTPALQEAKYNELMAAAASNSSTPTRNPQAASATDDNQPEKSDSGPKTEKENSTNDASTNAVDPNIANHKASETEDNSPTIFTPAHLPDPPSASPTHSKSAPPAAVSVPLKRSVCIMLNKHTCHSCVEEEGCVWSGIFNSCVELHDCQRDEDSCVLKVEQCDGQGLKLPAFLDGLSSLHLGVLAALCLCCCLFLGRYVCACFSDDAGYAAVSAEEDYDFGISDGDMLGTVHEVPMSPPMSSRVNNQISMKENFPETDSDDGMTIELDTLHTEESPVVAGSVVADSGPAVRERSPSVSGRLAPPPRDAQPAETISASEPDVSESATGDDSQRTESQGDASEPGASDDGGLDASLEGVVVEALQEEQLALEELEDDDGWENV